MNKAEFTRELHKKLSFLPAEEIGERLNFYSEMIDDRMEEGLSEEDAVAAVGSVDKIASQIMEEIPLAKIVKGKIKTKRRLHAWETVLLILGAPVWASLLVALVAVVVSLYIALWSVILSVWAVFVSVAACALGGIVAGAGIAVAGNGTVGLVWIGAGCVCAGLSVFLFYSCKAATKGTVQLTKMMGRGIKKGFMKKEAA